VVWLWLVGWGRRVVIGCDHRAGVVWLWLVGWGRRVVIGNGPGRSEPVAWVWSA